MTKKTLSSTYPRYIVDKKAIANTLEPEKILFTGYKEIDKIKSISNYENGKEQGEWRWYYETGELKEIANFEKGLLVEKKKQSKEVGIKQKPIKNN